MSCEPPIYHDVDHVYQLSKTLYSKGYFVNQTRFSALWGLVRPIQLSSDILGGLDLGTGSDQSKNEREISRIVSLLSKRVFLESIGATMLTSS